MHYYLWHVSPRSELRYLDPTKTKRTRCNVWLCTDSLLTWAIRHVQERHGTPLALLWCYRVRVRRALLRRTNRKGLWVCEKVLFVEARTLASARLEGGPGGK